MVENLLDRRLFLVLGGGAVSAAALTSFWQDPAVAADLDPAPFTLGVASGDPDADSVVLWTRLAPDPGAGGGMPATPVKVRWELARDTAFRHVVRRGEVWARPERAHAVHVLADRLTPDRWYFYQFTVDGVTSRTGRTRTLPPRHADTRRLRFAFASCQSWAGGPYPAYRDLAAQDLDFVVHLGDYVYETADGSLAEFRRLHSLYKSSPDLREAHARFPFFTTWDDHEVLNNWADDHKPNPDGRPFPERRRDAFQAYHEHLPMRTAPDGPDWTVYRRFRWGRLAEFSVLDTRQYRDAQACGDGMKPPCDEVEDPARTMTGPEQERWLLDGLRRSSARWNALAQQTILARFDYDLGPGRSYNLDQWDGYPAARQRILDTLTRVRNPVVLSGDWHSHWVNDILRDFDDPGSPVIATEFVGTSISSGIGWDAAVRTGLPVNPHVKLYNGTYRGYVMCEVTPSRWTSTLRVVLSSGAVRTLAAFEVRDGHPGARRLPDAGDGLSGRVTSPAGPLPNAEVLLRNPNGAVTVRLWTDGQGEYLAFAPPGDYTLEVHATGFTPVTRPVTLTDGTGTRADASLSRVAAPFASTNRRVPGPNTEGTPTDVVLGNDLLAMTVAVSFSDPQLPGATRGKPIDLAALGHLDQLDWLNLPYVAVAAPRGTEAWQQGLVHSTEVTTSGTTVEVTGAAGAVAVTTRYEVAMGTPWITATSTFTANVPITVWIGDAMDHDGPGQRSGVPGHGTITTPYANPATYTPTAPWIGMTGGDGQTYALRYEDTDFTAYGNGNWIQSQREVTLTPGVPWTLTRHIIAVTNNGDPWGVLADL